MERTKKFNVCIFALILVLVIHSGMISASAVTVTFVDDAYMKANDYNITDQSGIPVANWTGSHTLTLNPGRSYLVKYNPNGLFDLSKESPNDYTSLETILEFLKQHLAGLIVVFMGILGILLWRNQ